MRFQRENNVLLSLQSLLKKQKNSPAQSKASLNRKYMNKLKNLIAAFGCAGFYQDIKRKMHKIFILLIFILTSSIYTVCADETAFTARITDIDGNEYLIQNFSRDEFGYFNCKLREHAFKLDFAQIQSLTFTGEPGAILEGYTLATIVLVNNHSANLFIRSGNDAVQGLEPNFNIRIKIPIREIISITFIRE